jgi:hypothetical protein
MKTVAQALTFVERHGVVLASAKGPVPRLIEFIAQEPITGNWWRHPRANAIYNVLTQVSEAPDVLVCRLVNGRITLVHRRLWPALARLAGQLPSGQVARVVEEHTPSGRHVSRDVPFAEWVSAATLREAAGLSDAGARAQLGPWLQAPPTRGPQPALCRYAAASEPSVK